MMLRSRSSLPPEAEGTFYIVICSYGVQSPCLENVYAHQRPEFCTCRDRRNMKAYIPVGWHIHSRDSRAMPREPFNPTNIQGQSHYRIFPYLRTRHECKAYGALKLETVQHAERFDVL